MLYTYTNITCNALALSKNLFQKELTSKKSSNNGYSRLELSNHLGNVMVTVSDKRLGQDDGTGKVDYYLADVTSATDYYPFGSQMPGRSYTAPDSDYRFGFNGKEKDDDIDGISGSKLDFGARIYDARLGKFLNTDPWEGKYAWQTPYAYFKNSPISTIDFNGLGDYYDKDGAHLGNDGKTVKNDAGEDVSDDKAYVTTQATIDNLTKEGKTNWDKVISNSNTEALSVSNSNLNIFANSVAEESLGNKKESYGIASTIVNLMKYKGTDLINTMENENVYGYKTGGGNNSEYKDNAEYSMAAAINALTGGVDYSNGALRWSGSDVLTNDSYFKKKFNGFYLNEEHYNTSVKNNTSYFGKGLSSVKLKAGLSIATAGNYKGMVLYKSVAAHGGTIFWGKNGKNYNYQTQKAVYSLTDDCMPVGKIITITITPNKKFNGSW